MTTRHLPSIEALIDGDDDRLDVELKVRAVREHLAIARSLLDAVDDPLPASEPGWATPGRAFAIEELARLGCEIVELASRLSKARPPDSSVSLVSHAS